MADYTPLPRVGHDYFMTQLLQFPAHPWRVGSYFDRDPAMRHRSEQLRDAFLGRRPPPLPNHFPRAVQRTIPARLISQVHAERDLIGFADCRAPRRTLQV